VALLGCISNNRSYDDLALHTTAPDLADRLSVRVFDLETLIAVKERDPGGKIQK